MCVNIIIIIDIITGDLNAGIIFLCHAFNYFNIQKYKENFTSKRDKCKYILSVVSNISVICGYFIIYLLIRQQSSRRPVKIRKICFTAMKKYRKYFSLQCKMNVYGENTENEITLFILPIFLNISFINMYRRKFQSFPKISQIKITRLSIYYYVRLHL